MWFTWCGGSYSTEDLKQALAMLLRPDLGENDLLGQAFANPWSSANQQLCDADGLLLLTILAASQASQEVTPCMCQSKICSGMTQAVWDG